jgi:glutathione S-transferase
MADEIILYDLPSKQGFSWSLNPWKTRLALNIKGIPYKTQWIEYPDLKPTFQKLGIPPNDSGPYEYTSPAVRLPNGEYLMESRKIIDALEKLYPTPSLHLDSPYQARVEEFLPKVIAKVRPIFMPLVPVTFLNPPSKAYFEQDRERAIGMPLQEYHAKNAEQAYRDVEPLWKELAGFYAENEGGVWLSGGEVIYADVMVLGMLRMLDRLGVAERLWALEGGAALKAVYAAAAKWFERDTY